MSRHSQAGYTLIEMIIVTSIFALITLVLSRFTINGFNNYNYLQAQSNTATDLNNQIGRVSRVIRGTTSIVSAGANDLTLFGYFSPRDTVPDKIRYYVSGTNLLVDVIPATGTGPTYTYDNANKKTYTVTNNLTTAPAPVFSYYDDLGGSLGGAFSLGQVKQIGIFLSANPKPARLPVPISITTRVTLRNMKTNL